MQYSTRGQHIAADFWGVTPEILNDTYQLKKWMILAIERAGATVLDGCFHEFEPHGTTVLLLLSESHMSIHTYPEKGFAALDCYTCGEYVDPWFAISQMANFMNPEIPVYTHLERGVDPRV